MGLLPIDSFAIETSMTNHELLDTLSPHVDPPGFFRSFFRDHKEFQGTASLNGFAIRWIDHRPNFFLPIVYGHLLAKEDGTRIAVTMTLHPALWVGLVFVIGSLVAFGIGPCLGIFRDYIVTIFDIWMYLVLAILAWASTILFFQFEVANTKKRLGSHDLTSKTKALLRKLFLARLCHYSMSIICGALIAFQIWNATVIRTYSSAGVIGIPLGEAFQYGLLIGGALGIAAIDLSRRRTRPFFRIPLLFFLITIGSFLLLTYAKSFREYSQGEWICSNEFNLDRSGFVLGLCMLAAWFYSWLLLRRV